MWFAALEARLPGRHVPGTPSGPLPPRLTLQHPVLANLVQRGRHLDLQQSKGGGRGASSAMQARWHRRGGRMATSIAGCSRWASHASVRGAVPGSVQGHRKQCRQAHRRPSTEVDGTNEGCAGTRAACTKQRVQLLLHSWRGGGVGQFWPAASSGTRATHAASSGTRATHAGMRMLEQAAISFWSTCSRKQRLQPASPWQGGMQPAPTSSAHPCAVLEQVVCFARLSREQLPGAASVVKAWLEGLAGWQGEWKVEQKTWSCVAAHVAGGKGCRTPPALPQPAREAPAILTPTHQHHNSAYQCSAGRRQWKSWRVVAAEGKQTGA